MTVDLSQLKPGYGVTLSDGQFHITSIVRPVGAEHFLVLLMNTDERAAVIYRRNGEAYARNLPSIVDVESERSFTDRCYKTPVRELIRDRDGQKPAAKKYWMITTRTIRRDDDEYERYVTTVTDLNPVEHALANCDGTHTTTVVWAHEIDHDTFMRLEARYAISAR